jgi:RNA pol II accessory factor, Cdc73 family, C-terminal
MTHARTQDNTFIPANASDAEGRPHQHIVTIQRPAPDAPDGRPRKPIPYDVLAEPPKLSDVASWDRVVGVICLGKNWQFKNYPIKVRHVSHVTHL